MSVRKRETCSPKTVCNIKSREICKPCSLGKNTEKFVKTPSEVADGNMEMAAKEVHSISNNNRDIKSTDVTLHCTWNSRG